MFKSLSCYKKGEVIRNSKPLIKLSDTYFTVEQIKIETDDKMENIKSINKESLSFFESYEFYEKNKFKSIINMVTKIFKEKLVTYDFKETNNKTYVSFNIEDSVTKKDSSLLKAKINKGIYHINMQNGLDGNTIIEIHLKNPLQQDYMMELNQKIN